MARCSEFDALRAGAILYIVGFWHLCDYAAPLHKLLQPELMRLTETALGLFVFLSGLLLSGRYDIADAADAFRFWRRRLLRIYPLYLLALGGFVATGLLERSQFRSACLGIGVLTGDPPVTLWFVAMILVFYFLYPALVWRYRPARTLALTVAIAAVLALAHRQTGAVDLRLIIYLPAFALGIVLARSPRTLAYFQRPRVVMLTFLLCIAAFGLTVSRSSALLWMGREIMIVAAWPVLLSAGRLAAARLNGPTLAILSYASFAMYLGHRLVFQTGIRLYQPDTAPAALLYLYGVLLPLTVASAYAVQKAYDAALDYVGAWLRGLRNARIDSPATGVRPS